MADTVNKVVDDVKYRPLRAAARRAITAPWRARTWQLRTVDKPRAETIMSHSLGSDIDPATL